jgi:hypothetical protein
MNKMGYYYEQYYFARELAGNLGLGKIWFLKAPKENNPEFDGGKFLGSLVKYIDDWFVKDYPIPLLDAAPDQVIIKILESLKQDDGKYIKSNNPRNKLQHISDEIITKSKLMIPMTKLKESSSFEGDITANIPGIPISVNMDVDLSDVKSIEIGMKEARVEYIKQGLLILLSDCFNNKLELLANKKQSLGDSEDLEDLQIVDEVIFASKYTVKYVSSTSFVGKLKIDGSLTSGGVPVKVGVGVTAKIESERSLVLEVDQGKEYLLGLKTTSWADMDFE